MQKYIYHFSSHSIRDNQNEQKQAQESSAQ